MWCTEAHLTQPGGAYSCAEESWSSTPLRCGRLSFLLPLSVCSLHRIATVTGVAARGHRSPSAPSEQRRGFPHPSLLLSAYHLLPCPVSGVRGRISACRLRSYVCVCASDSSVSCSSLSVCVGGSSSRIELLACCVGDPHIDGGKAAKESRKVGGTHNAYKSASLRRIRAEVLLYYRRHLLFWVCGLAALCL